MADVLARPNARFTHVARSSILIGVLFGLDKLLGLIRQVIIGRQFGVSRELDAFNAANNLPDLLFALITGGALAIAFIPVLSEYLDHDGRQAAWDLFSRVANWAFVITGALAVVIFVFASPIVRGQIGVAPGFSPELQSLVADLMRLNLVATLIFSLSGLVIAGLQANQHFLLPALAPSMYDVGQIFGALILAPERGYPIAGITLPAAGLGVHGLVYGVIIGASLHLAVQVPALIKYKFRWSPRIGLDHPGLRKVAQLMGPRILTIGAFQLVFIVQDNLASRLEVGSVTALAYGWLIMQVPETIIGTAVGTAILPTLAEQFARGDDRSFEASVGRATSVLLATTLPIAVVLMIGIQPLIQLAFHFEARGTELVAWAARAYLLGLVGHSLLEVGARAWYARQNARIPLMASAISTAVFTLSAIALFRVLGAAGIGLSNSLAFTVEALLLLALLSRSFPGVLPRLRQLGRGFVAALAAGLLAALIATMAPLGDAAASIVGLTLGALLAVPFIWPELRQLAAL
jgi:putative peptidoglycan lipid II flippase